MKLTKKLKTLCLFVIVILIIIIIIIICSVKGANSCCLKYNTYLTGMWVGDLEFIKKANLSDLQIFIAPKEQKKRNGYILMVDNNKDFILNQPIELKELSSQHSQRWSANTANKKIDDMFTIQYELSTDVKNIYPKKIIFTVSIINGVLSIKDENGKIYALLTKDLIASASAISAYKE
jgi:hypothetical protein